MRCLNLGCGRRIHPKWVNVDFRSSSQDVLAADLSKGVPFPDNQFDVVYHSHLIEHFSRANARSFLDECMRVLRSGGIIRVAAPDMEGIARQYLASLEAARKGLLGAPHDYEWMMLEMLDQLVRDRPGGDMSAYLFSDEIPNEDFVLSRCGAEAKQLIAEGKRKRVEAGDRESKPSSLESLKRVLRIFLKRECRKEFLLKYLLRDEPEVLRIGRFRMSGENHLWMYDTYSLGMLLTEAGFVDVVERGAGESYVDEWISYNLDTETDGAVYKPDSIYLEAVKP